MQLIPRSHSKALLAIALVCTVTSAIAEETKQGFLSTFESAFSHDPRLKQAFHKHQAEREDANISAANLLPSVQINANYQYENSDNIYTDENSSFYEQSNERSGGELIDKIYRVTIQQPLFNYSAYKGYQRDKAYAASSALRYERSKQELIYKVAEQYLRVLLAAHEVFLNEKKLTALELKQSQADRAQELGVGDQLSVLKVKASKDLARSDLLQAKSQLSDATTLLSNYTGTNVHVPDEWVQNSQDINLELLTGTQEDWLEKVSDNLSIKEARKNILQEELNLSSRKGEHFPTLKLNIGYLDRRSDDEFRVREDMTAAIEFSMPLYSGGRTQANIRKARSRLLASQSQLDYIISEKEQQIKLSYNRLISFKERLEALVETRESSKGYLEAAERQLSLNLGQQISVLDARTQLVDTQIQFAKTLNDYLLSDLILRLESGDLTEQRLHEYDELFSTPSN
ncbi:TolC family protein [Neptunomonas sp.]|uniref:TolC family protein n=1 Tax=Neptunomonas sp. TaxID=1971898 RepID=UPI0025E435A3|nr:TolC family protein [Neptunomonas sp.]